MYSCLKPRKLVNRQTGIIIYIWKLSIHYLSTVLNKLFNKWQILFHKNLCLRKKSIPVMSIQLHRHMISYKLNHNLLSYCRLNIYISHKILLQLLCYLCSTDTRIHLPYGFLLRKLRVIKQYLCKCIKKSHIITILLHCFKIHHIRVSIGCCEYQVIITHIIILKSIRCPFCSQRKNNTFVDMRVSFLNKLLMLLIKTYYIHVL